MNIHLSPQHTEQNKTTTYDIGNPSPGLAQVQKCGRVQPVKGVKDGAMLLKNICSIFICLYCIWFFF
jgi:hypothetical protein